MFDVFILVLTLEGTVNLVCFSESTMPSQSDASRAYPVLVWTPKQRPLSLWERVRVRAFYVLLYFKLPSPQPSPKGRGEDVLVVLANLTTQKRPVYTVIRYKGKKNKHRLYYDTPLAW